MELHIHGTEVMNELIPLARELRHAAPDVMKAFGELHRAAMSPGTLDTKTKELIALAIAVSKQCDGCIASHAKGAAKAGAT